MVRSYTVFFLYIYISGFPVVHKHSRTKILFNLYILFASLLKFEFIHVILCRCSCKQWQHQQQNQLYTNIRQINRYRNNLLNYEIDLEFELPRKNKNQQNENIHGNPLGLSTQINKR